MTDLVFRSRRLPHQDIEGHPIFLTACLDGSLSASGLSRICKYRDELDERPKPDRLSESEWEHRKHKLLFAFVDDLLDGQTPVQHLADDRQAEIVQNAFLHFANDRYQLLAFVVMPSHAIGCFCQTRHGPWQPCRRHVGTREERRLRERSSPIASRATPPRCATEFEARQVRIGSTRHSITGPATKRRRYGSYSTSKGIR